MMRNMMRNITGNITCGLCVAIMDEACYRHVATRHSEGNVCKLQKSITFISVNKISVKTILHLLK